MTGGSVRISTLAATLLAFCLLAAAGASAVRADAVSPTIYFDYSMNCTFTILDDSGRTITSIAPGNYTVDVRTPIAFGTIPRNSSDMTACRGMAQFQLTGPGVNFTTTVSAGCEADYVTTLNFQPGATYVAQDLNQPSVARASFSVLTSGTPGTVNASYGSATGGKGSTNDSIVGSGLNAAVGTLVGTLKSNGALTLTQGGKPVTRLKQGRYSFTITDKSAKLGFGLLGPKTRSTIRLTTPGFVGRHTVTVNLAATGRWTYLGDIRAVRTFRVVK
jgi:hypothetical protein